MTAISHGGRSIDRDLLIAGHREASSLCDWLKLGTSTL